MFRILCDLRRFGQGFLLLVTNGHARDQVVEIDEPFEISTEEVAEYAEISYASNKNGPFETGVII